jgi:D-alanyl-D-alanine carboxypeptidase/D-alanyl-D-alanine-endopeptidase (penicillin-binding protein 4)
MNRWNQGHRTGACGLLWWALTGLAQAQPAPLPDEVDAALRRARVPADAVSVVVQEVGNGRELLSWRADEPVNPASLFKLITTYAALDLLGPAWVWSTPVLVSGTLGPDGVLDGSVTLQGRGDPKLVVERVWLLLRRLQQAGVREIRGDILLDRSAFAASTRTPGDFDGEPHRPQNVQPDALLLNQKTVVYSFLPDPVQGLARIAVEPPLTGVQVDASVPLARGPCDDWRTALKPQLTEPARVRFAGTYAEACGERSWPMASAEPAAFGARLVARLWQELGGRLGGQVRDGQAPAGSRLLFEHTSPPLAEVVRDINKFSNNVMAEQLFLSLALPPASAPVSGAAAPPGPSASAATSDSAAAASASAQATLAAGPVTVQDARALLQRWLANRLGETNLGGLVIDNGSGLSRDARLRLQLLARLLQAAWDSPVMSELMSSLPVSGTDGTLRRSTAAPGRAHLKTGSLRDVAGVAGYVWSANGRRHVVVAVVNHPQAAAARPALDALVQWVVRGSDAASNTSAGSPPKRAEAAVRSPAP